MNFDQQDTVVLTAAGGGIGLAVDGCADKAA
jgi:hypothetical protein